MLFGVLKHVLNLSINQEVTPILKSGDEYLLTNYRPTSVLPCFSKILDRIMFNRVYDFLTENKMLYEKQFGFQSAHSTEYAILQLSNEIILMKCNIH